MIILKKLQRVIYIIKITIFIFWQKSINILKGLKL